MLKAYLINKGLQLDTEADTARQYLYTNRDAEAAQRLSVALLRKESFDKFCADLFRILKI